jgi:DNA primase
MADQTTELIREKVEIADFIKQYVELRPAGRSLKGLCPFHKEKSGSFMVNRDRQIWHCFGCGKGGDIFGFLMQYENIEFIEALKILADRAGIALQRTGTGDRRSMTSFSRLIALLRIFINQHCCIRREHRHSNTCMNGDLKMRRLMTLRLEWLNLAMIR